MLAPGLSQQWPEEPRQQPGQTCSSYRLSIRDDEWKAVYATGKVVRRSSTAQKFGQLQDDGAIMNAK